MNYPIHNHPSDYWRFTPEAFKSLLRMFSFSIVESLGENDFPHSVVGVGFKNSISENTKNEFLKKISVWKTYWDNPPKSRWKKSAKLFIPPIVLDIYHKFVKIKY